MNILKLLNSNEVAMVSAGQIYWAYDENGVDQYFSLVLNIIRKGIE